MAALDRHYTTARLPRPVVGQCRSCGSCTACCTTHAVYEISKPHGQRCAHACASGCAIYPERPETCRDYACLWLQGFIEGDERRRPDRLGLVFSMNAAPGGATIIQCQEVWPGAADSGNPGGYFLGKLTKKYAVQLIRFDDSAFLLPTWEPINFVPEDRLWGTPLWDKWLRGDDGVWSDLAQSGERS